jgi:hypothetical protein
MNLLKAEAVLENIFPMINNLNRLRQKDDDENQPEEQTDRQSIFSRLSRSSKMSRKVSSSCSRQRLKMMIAADRISIHSFATQARAQIKYQKGYIRRAAKSSFSPTEAERWYDEVAALPDMLDCQFIGARQVRYLAQPAKGGYALLCQTKTYKNEMREQDRRLMYIEKVLRDLK